MSTNDKYLKQTTEYSAEDAMFMKMAIDLSVDNIDAGGGPFGAVIVRDGEVIATGANRVVPDSDPTAHAEVVAIRKACAKLGTFQLTGCTAYCSCEPCPMCLSASLWANIDKIYYGCSLKDNEKIGFRDKKFDKMLGGHKHIPKNCLKQKDRKLCLKLFNEYNNSKKELY